MEPKKIIYDYSKLKGRIIEMFGSQTSFIRKINMSSPTFIRKINNDGYFSQPEMEEIAETLKINISEINDYFFVKKVRKT